MGRKDANKPRGRMSSYAFFVQTCREEHKKKHPGESVVFTEFTKKCAEKWKVNLIPPFQNKNLLKSNYFSLKTNFSFSCGNTL